MTRRTEPTIHLPAVEHLLSVTATETVRLILADPQPLLRRGLRAIFEAEPDLEVVDEIDHGEHLVALTRHWQPHVVVLDTELPGAEALALTRQLVTGEPPCAVVLIAQRLNGDFALEALRAGVRGLLYKDDKPADLVRTIRAVAAGEALLTPRVTLEVLDELRRIDPPVPAPRREDGLAIDTLTPRELQIFRLIAEGRTNQQIATSLLLSEATVKSHFNRIGKKLGVRGRAHAVIMAYRIGLVRSSE